MFKILVDNSFESANVSWISFVLGNKIDDIRPEASGPVTYVRANQVY